MRAICLQSLSVPLPHDSLHSLAGGMPSAAGCALPKLDVLRAMAAAHPSLPLTHHDKG